MSRTKTKLPKLPKKGDTSNAAIGRRLEHARTAERLTVVRAARLADATPAQWRAWESGKAAIPPRNAWLVARNVGGSVEWLLTGYHTEHAMPDVLPVLGDDLSGFAARVKQARQRLGFSIADVGRLGFVPFTKREWLQWEAAEDEPDYESATMLVKVLEVSPEWLFTDTEPAAKPAKPGRRYQCDLSAGEPRDFTIGPRLKAAREAAGLSRKDVALLTGRFLTLRKLAQLEDGARLNETAANSLRHHVKQYVAMFAQLYGVPLESLLYGDAELIILRRRVERLRRRFGLPSTPGKRQADAA